MRASERRLLEIILTQPTAPFRERYVQAAIERVARELDLMSRRDTYGNLYVGYRHGHAAPVAFTAHMDHPGFEVVEGGTQARAAFLGGVTAECMLGAPVLCFDPVMDDAIEAPPEPSRGRIVEVEAKLAPGSSRPQLTLHLELDAPARVGGFGCFDLPGLELEGDLLRSRSLDNLMSCVCVLAALANLRERGAEADVLGVFTRAEEVGFVGAGGVLRSPQLEPERPLVVLETSKEMPGFHIGSGPVLRVGDRMTCFDPEMDLWMANSAAELAVEEPDFTYQRALMTGGACEASLYILYRRRVGAIALPLGNYHNMTPEGGIGPEYISSRDFEHLLRLLEYLALHPPTHGVLEARRAELDATFDRLSHRLDPR